MEWKSDTIGPVGLWYVGCLRFDCISSLTILSYLGGSLVAAGELTIGSLSSLMLYTVSYAHGYRMSFAQCSFLGICWKWSSDAHVCFPPPNVAVFTNESIILLDLSSCVIPDNTPVMWN